MMASATADSAHINRSAQQFRIDVAKFFVLDMAFTASVRRIRRQSTV